MSTSRTIAQLFGAGEVDTFIGLPKAHPAALPPGMCGAIVGVPGVTPYASVGSYCAGGPQAIRAGIAGYAETHAHFDFDAGRALFESPPTVVDCGDLPFDADDFPANRARVRETVDAILDADAMPILIGGDDSLPLPLIEACAARGPLTILQIDAHIDWRDEVQGERHGLSSGMRRASETAHVERIVQVGIRAIGSARQADRDDAVAWGARIITGREVARHGVGPVLEMIPAGARVVVCLDLDGMDPSIMPAVLSRAPGGLGYWDVIELIEGVSAKGTLVGFEMCEFVPEADVDGIGAIHAARILLNVVHAAARRATS